MSSPVALNVKLSKTTQTCCGKEGVKANPAVYQSKLPLWCLFACHEYRKKTSQNKMCLWNTNAP